MDKKVISFFVIVFMWTFVSIEASTSVESLNSVSGKTYKFSGHWKSYMKSCWSGGNKYFVPTYNLGNLKSSNISYDSLNENSVIRADGNIDFYTKATGYVNHQHFLLDHYMEENGRKIYCMKIDITAKVGWAKQECKVKLELSVQKSGEILLQPYAYAGSWGAISCAETKCDIFTLTINP